MSDQMTKKHRQRDLSTNPTKNLKKSLKKTEKEEPTSTTENQKKWNV